MTGDVDERDLLEFDTVMRLDLALPGRVTAGPGRRRCSHCGRQSSPLRAEELHVVKRHREGDPKGYLILLCAEHLAGEESLGRTRSGARIHRRNETCEGCGTAKSLAGVCDYCD